VVRRTETVGDETMDATSVTLDGVAQSDGSIPLVDDGRVHRVQVDMRIASRSAA